MSWFMCYKLHCAETKDFFFCAERHTEDLWKTSICETVSTATLGLYLICPSYSHFFSNSCFSTISAKLKGKRKNAQILPTSLPTMCSHFRITWIYCNKVVQMIALTQVILILCLPYKSWILKVQKRLGNMRDSFLPLLKSPLLFSLCK